MKQQMPRQEPSCNERKKALWIACGQQTVLALEELQPAGKGRQSIAAFLNGTGQHIQLGDKVGTHEA